jgi:methionine-S-sulfoxide reductase
LLVESDDWLVWMTGWYGSPAGMDGLTYGVALMNKSILALLALLLCLGGCKTAPPGDQSGDSSNDQASEAPASEASSSETAGEQVEALPASPEDPSLEIATFAGGCFWCMEPPFDKTEGVERTIVGYTGGDEEHPTYREVASGQTSHAEAVRVYYDPDKVSYDELLDVFWRNINPTQKGGQFVDVGAQYRTAIFVHDDEQRELAEKSKQKLDESERFDKAIVTEIETADSFWKAEEYHQDFYIKSPGRYKSYRSGSGRDEFIERTWGEE